MAAWRPGPPTYLPGMAPSASYRRHLTKILQNSWGPSNYLNEKGLSRNVILQIKTSNAPHHHASEIRYAPHHHTSEIRYAPLASVFRCARVASELHNIQKLTSDIRYACDASEFRYATLTRESCYNTLPSDIRYACIIKLPRFFLRTTTCCFDLHGMLPTSHPT
jgi:hypothetical protein